jgi:predicted nucleic acid-binding protein
LPDYFADTYALWAFYKGSRAYRPYFERHELATTAINLVEFSATLLRSGDAREQDLRSLLAPLRPMVVEPAPHVVEAAAAFKANMAAARKNCSHVDAWGYATARSLSVPFLTGDREFKAIPAVEFVKE